MQTQKRTQIKNAYEKRMEREDLIKHNIRKEQDLNGQIEDIKTKKGIHASSLGRIASNLEG